MLLNEILRLRKEIIIKGKHSKSFGKIAKKKLKAGKGRKEKYCDLMNTAESGSIDENDCSILHNLVLKYNPKMVLEIGTWFGVSAMVFDKSMGSGTVVTIDKNSVMAYESDTVKCHNGLSKDILKDIRDKYGKFDLVFADASLGEGDEKRIKRLVNDKFVFITHDYEGKEKGVKNMRLMRALFQNNEIQLFGKSTIALMEVM